MMMMMIIIMLQCGHCYCVECIRIIIDEYSTRRATKCAVCRSMTAHAEISYVSTQPEQPELELEEEVRGSHSTKVEAVLRSAFLLAEMTPCNVVCAGVCCGSGPRTSLPRRWCSPRGPTCSTSSPPPWTRTASHTPPCTGTPPPPRTSSRGTSRSSRY